MYTVSIIPVLDRGSASSSEQYEDEEEEDEVEGSLLNLP